MGNEWEVKDIAKKLHEKVVSEGLQPPIKLFDNNYYSQEADKLFMSVSQWKSFRHCEFQALAVLNGEYKRPEKDALRIGSYIHAAIEGPEALEKFKQDNPDIYSSQGPTKGQLKAGYKFIEKTFDVLDSDPRCNITLQGEKEVPMTFFWAGAWWKIKPDVLNREDYCFTDLKKCRDIYGKEFDERQGKYVHFVQYYGYLYQLALYSLGISINMGRKDWPQAYLTCATVPAKEDEWPDFISYVFDSEILRRDYLSGIEKSMPRVLAVKSGQEKPRRCGRCEWCLQNKTLTGFPDYFEWWEQEIAGMPIGLKWYEGQE